VDGFLQLVGIHASHCKVIKGGNGFHVGYKIRYSRHKRMTFWVSFLLAFLFILQLILAGTDWIKSSSLCVPCQERDLLVILPKNNRFELMVETLGNVDEFGRCLSFQCYRVCFESQ
jgi:hypothetical protein